ncbi:MAG: hypothetical protein JRI97_04800 [Deltaproteobacteria bacterium]|nr:hypothetical protein [Deltaproteobacteria bacterium]
MPKESVMGKKSLTKSPGNTGGEAEDKKRRASEKQAAEKKAAAGKTRARKPTAPGRPKRP